MADTRKARLASHFSSWAKISKPAVHDSSRDNIPSSCEPSRKRKRDCELPCDRALRAVNSLDKRTRKGGHEETVSSSSSSEASHYTSQISQSADQASDNSTEALSAADQNRSTKQEFSPALQSLVDLHIIFLKALSLHFAHHGPHTPATIDWICRTTTQMWSRRTVTLVDVQRMLAIVELSSLPVHSKNETIAHSLGPFKLVKTEADTIVQRCEHAIETRESRDVIFNTNHMHRCYKSYIRALHNTWTRESPACLSFLGDSGFSRFPKLAIEIGTQTAAKQLHVSHQRAEILGLPSTASAVKAETVPLSDSRNTNDSGQLVGYRRICLMDRIKEKQLSRRANRKSAVDILREQSLHRVEEVAEILRMMQRQRRQGATASYDSDLDDVLEDRPQTSRHSRLSFSLAQVLSTVRNSAKVPLSKDEVLTCLKLLDQGLGSSWIKLLNCQLETDVGFVVMEGAGLNGREAQRKILEKQS